MMLDGAMRRVIDPSLNRAGLWMAQRGADADAVTIVGLAIGLLAALMIALGLPGWLALVPLLISRVADGLDGAIARATQKTDFGGYLDITSDFMFYGAVPLAFVMRDSVGNGATGAFLLASFYVNGASFLGYAVLAEKRGLETTHRGEKSLYFTTGLLEGTETIAFFTAICLWPAFFNPLALVFGTLCLLTAGTRVYLARRVFSDDLSD